MCDCVCACVAGTVWCSVNVWSQRQLPSYTLKTYEAGAICCLGKGYSILRSWEGGGGESFTDPSPHSFCLFVGFMVFGFPSAPEDLKWNITPLTCILVAETSKGLLLLPHYTLRKSGGQQAPSLEPFYGPYTLNSMTESGHVKYQEKPLACKLHGSSAWKLFFLLSLIFTTVYLNV